jgi:prepilin-type N-terminal cleavage/methylation domain-containing protein
MKSKRYQKAGIVDGFTLIELLIVMLISSILLLGMTSAYRQAYKIWSHIESRRPFYQNSRIIISTLRQELSCLYFPPAEDANDAAGESEKLEPLLVEENSLSFCTLRPLWKGSLHTSRIARVRYSLMNDPMTDEAVLMRYEQPLAGEKLMGKESSDVVAKGIAEFSVSVVQDEQQESGEDEEDENDGGGDTPPKAIEISLKWAAVEDSPDTTFQTTILIPCQASLPKQN